MTKKKINTKNTSDPFLSAIENGDYESAKNLYSIGKFSSLDVWNAALKTMPWNNNDKIDNFIIEKYPLKEGLGELDNFIYRGRFELLKYYLNDTKKMQGKLICLKHYENIAKYLVKHNLIDFKKSNFEVKDWVFGLKQGRISVTVFKRILNAYCDSLKNLDENLNIDMEDIIKFASKSLDQEIIDYLIEIFIEYVNLKTLLQYCKNEPLIENKINKEEKYTNEVIAAALKGHQSPHIISKLEPKEIIWKKVLEDDISKAYTLEELKEILKDSPSDITYPMKNAIAIIAYFDIHKDELNADEIFDKAFGKCNKVAAHVLPITKKINVSAVIQQVVENDNRKMLDALLDMDFKHREEVREYLFSSNNEYVNKVMRTAIEKDANHQNTSYFLFF